MTLQCLFFRNSCQVHAAVSFILQTGIWLPIEICNVLVEIILKRMQKAFYHFLLLSNFGLQKINRSAVEIRHISLFLVPEGKWFLKCHKRVHFQELNYKRTLENISGDPFVKGKPQERGDSGDS